MPGHVYGVPAVRILFLITRLLRCLFFQQIYVFVLIMIAEQPAHGTRTLLFTSAAKMYTACRGIRVYGAPVTVRSNGTIFVLLDAALDPLERLQKNHREGWEGDCFVRVQFH